MHAKDMQLKRKQLNRRIKDTEKGLVKSCFTRPQQAGWGGDAAQSLCCGTAGRGKNRCDRLKVAARQSYAPRPPSPTHVARPGWGAFFFWCAPDSPTNEQTWPTVTEGRGEDVRRTQRKERGGGGG